MYNACDASVIDRCVCDVSEFINGRGNINERSAKVNAKYLMCLYRFRIPFTVTIIATIVAIVMLLFFGSVVAILLSIL